MGGDTLTTGVRGIATGAHGTIATGTNLRRRGARSTGTTVASTNGAPPPMVPTVGTPGKTVPVGGSAHRASDGTKPSRTHRNSSTSRFVREAPESNPERKSPSVELPVERSSHRRGRVFTIQISKRIISLFIAHFAQLCNGFSVHFAPAPRGVNSQHPRVRVDATARRRHCGRIESPPSRPPPANTETKTCPIQREAPRRRHC